MAVSRTKPAHQGLVHARVLSRHRVSPGFVRVVLGGDDLAAIEPMGHDHWVRFFLPSGEGSLERLPGSMGLLSYARYRALPAARRPVLRNYTIADLRHGDGGPELDIDFAVHEAPDGQQPGPAIGWALGCREGDPVALIDEGITFAPPEGVASFLLVGDETALPGIAGILRSLPDDARGTALLEVASAEDVRELPAPAGVELRWLPRTDPHAVPGALALAAVQQLPAPDAGG
ncbi:siderophore-interacting protein, partial [Desertihabitans aurantiacus]|uniref:siderophore-interacting protein n=1 Tax=Desertihabitans aurantiacus TaxID=2282477 RepID=UPI0013008395